MHKIQFLIILTLGLASGGNGNAIGISYNQVYHRSYYQQYQQQRPLMSLLENSVRALEFRARLCPNIPPDLLPIYRFHLISRKCYEVGSRGPCGSNMIFVKQPSTLAIGKCICRPPQLTSTNAFRPLIHHFETNDCYFVYKQGYCPSTEWLILDDDDRPRCSPNPCLDIGSLSENELEFKEFVPLNYTCAELGSVSDQCGSGQIVAFTRHGRPGCVNLTLIDNEII